MDEIKEVGFSFKHSLNCKIVIMMRCCSTVLGSTCVKCSIRLPSILWILSCLSLLLITSPPSAKMAPQRECSPHPAESQQSKEVSSFSSSTSSPWDSPDNPLQALKPVPARAQSAPITLPTEPIDPIKSPAAASPPKSVDAFSSVSWSQSQWIAFSDNFAPSRRQGSGSSAKELQRPQSGSGRSSRFPSDDSADVCCKTSGSREDGIPCVSDVVSGITDRTMAAAPSGKIFTGNMKLMLETCFSA